MASRSSSTYIPFCDINQGTCPFVGPRSSRGVVAGRPILVSLRQLRFRNPQYFKAGEIHNLSFVWIMGIIRDGVHNEHFFKYFQENFRGSRTTRRGHLPFTLVTL